MQTEERKRGRPGNEATSKIYNVFPPANIKVEATCAVLRPISEVPSHWRALDGEVERTIERTPFLVRNCADDIPVSIRYDVKLYGYNKIVPDEFPRFWEIKCMHKQFFFPPTKSLGTRLE